jgi:DUF971 family protein
MIKPTGITANRETKQVAISWEDEHESLYPFSLLRYACPCASCRGGHGKMSDIPDPEIFHLPSEDSPSTRIQQIEPVGSYAITIEWEDGHHFGIYKWDYLRSLCPCKICRSIYFDGR